MSTAAVDAVLIAVASLDLSRVPERLPYMAQQPPQPVDGLLIATATKTPAHWSGT